MTLEEKALQLHYEMQGKIEVVSRKSVCTREDLSLLYTPGVAEPCRVIAKDESESYRLTRRSNLVAVITDGTAVLGLGDIGPAAGMPVMEGKCVLFKEFGGVDAFPICVDSKDVDTIVQTIHLISKSFGGINLEDISAPRCFEIERRLKEICDIPVFHDDQHGTAIVVAAAMLNVRMGFGNIILCDINGMICEGDAGLNAEQEKVSHITNLHHEKGTLADALRNADAFVGVSRPNMVTKEMVASMNEGIVFAMANPVPEIMYEEAKEAGARIMATGRSDCPNQINNVLVFPGLFRGALDCRARDITYDMKLAAAYGIADLVREEELGEEYIIPSAFDERVARAVAEAVKRAAGETAGLLEEEQDLIQK